MPCNCDHLEANNREIESKRLCQCLLYLLSALGRSGPHWVIAGASDYYGAPHHLEQGTIWLCKLCAELPPHVANRVIYDGKNPDSRKLADWWDEHQQADRERVAKELAAAKTQKEIQAALAKLTDHERALLGR